MEESKKYYLEALEIEKQTGRVISQKDIYNNLLKIALIKQELRNSLIFQNKRDSLYVLQAKIENDEKLKLVENQHKLISSRKELEQIKAINQKNQIIFISILIALVLLGLFFWQRIKNKELALLQEKANLEQTVLRSQMNPHFIFNALSAIQNSLFDNDPIKSATYISRFAKLIRQNFDFITKKYISLADEIDALKNYMDTQKIRFKDKFDYSIHIAEEIDTQIAKIPPLLIQPLIENSIEHGFKGKQEKGIITIRVSVCKENRICYEIKDNGKGFPEKRKDTKTHSLNVFEKRLKLLEAKDEKTLSIQSDSKGTTIKFSLIQ